MTAQGVDDARLEAPHLDVQLHGQSEPRDERERLVEQRRVSRHLGAVSDHEPGQHVELDGVGAAGSGRLDRGEARLGRERRRAAMADAHDSAPASKQLHQPVRRITTTARSSDSSPPAYVRASSVTARASSAAGRSRSRASSASSRSVPYSSPPLRASTTPSV